MSRAMQGSFSSDNLEAREKKQNNYENTQTLNYAYMPHLEVFFDTQLATYDNIDMTSYNTLIIYLYLPLTSKVPSYTGYN